MKGVDICIVLVMCGMIIGYGIMCVVDLKMLFEGVWVLCGECGLIYVEILLEGSEFIVGCWWLRDYSGLLFVLIDE